MSRNYYAKNDPNSPDNISAEEWNKKTIKEKQEAGQQSERLYRKELREKNKKPNGQNIKTSYKSPYDKDKREPDFEKHGKLSGDDEAVVYKKKNPVQTKTEKAKAWLKNRAEAIAQNTQDIRPRGRGPSPHTTLGMGLPANPDLFGVGAFGGMHNMMGADPFHEMYPRRNPQPIPQRKKKRKGKRRAPAAPRSQGGMPGMMGGIPKHMKWMFGQ
jgi:hypothetical protein